MHRGYQASVLCSQYGTIATARNKTQTRRGRARQRGRIQSIVQNRCGSLSIVGQGCGRLEEYGSLGHAAKSGPLTADQSRQSGVCLLFNLFLDTYNTAP